MLAQTSSHRPRLRCHRVKQDPDRAAAYYHFALAHMYEEQVAMYGRSELANKAIEEYRARH